VRTPGKSSARHGFVEDAVLGVSAVLADGRTIHTRVAPRRSTGPDLARALCGSEGTLGFITSAVLRIHRAPEARFLAAYALPDFAAAIAAVNLALREEAAPSALRVYGAREARVHLAGAASAGGLGAHEAALVVATAGPTDLAACDRDLFTSAVEAMGGRSLDVAVAETWWRRRSGRADGPLPPLPSLQVTAAPPRQVPVYEAVFAAVRDAGARARVHASRFDYDGAVLFFSLTDDADQMLRGGELARIRGVAEAAAERAGAVLLGRLNPALDPYLLELRRALDPRGIMNPDALSR
jgi:FAD/FMN-containing dehydrogenase